MPGFWRSLLQRIQQGRRPDTIRIAIEETAILIVKDEQCLIRIALDEIDRIEAYKIDEWATDLICFDLHTKQNGEPIMVFIHEETAGFAEMTDLLRTLPGFDRDWREKVFLPPFEENRTVIFTR